MKGFAEAVVVVIDGAADFSCAAGGATDVSNAGKVTGRP